ncbi:uncharacterized protein A4U43_C07F10110 [Asparagus officinalis]|uniref:Uncharacterized protein n=1 Tax=Asparagus officinalis TaxID=4686 RepID=A0A5P1EAQ4_ASPOF|nr:uncharacterized protein A4U43_C07F10110 [Asparagus officinalis]
MEASGDLGCLHRLGLGRWSRSRRTALRGWRRRRSPEPTRLRLDLGLWKRDGLRRLDLGSWRRDGRLQVGLPKPPETGEKRRMGGGDWHMRLERVSPLGRVESEVEEDGAAVRISGQRGDESAVGAGSKMVKDGVADDDEVWRRLVADRRGEPAW